jgi:[pyruvate, water dikinase]-phosphate phosphotransferase / [pyruvate, water dikinase] kinase
MTAVPQTGRRAASVHLISDSTGETLNAVARAALARFSRAAPDLHVAVLIRSDAEMAAAIDELRRHPGAVLYTIADPQRRAQLLDACRDLGVTATSVLDPVIAALSEHLGEPPSERAGLQHRISSEYFARISALDFATTHDDGALGHRLLQADVILTGVSRTSKTPTCIYLAYRGTKAANVPLLPSTEPDAALIKAMEAGVPVVGLTASPARLSQIRSQRLEAMGAGYAPDYADLDRIRVEVAEARLFFDRHEIPVIDVTTRSIEETAAAILVILRGRGRADA